MSASKYNFAERLRLMRVKRRLKAALRRKPKPAKVRLKDEDVPNER